MNEYKQFKLIREDIDKLTSEIVKQISEETRKDLIVVYDNIITNYYNDYKPKHYRRHGIGGLFGGLQKHKSYLTNKYTGTALVTVGSSGMEEHYNTSADTVFDLVWNSGIRGLPKKGLEPLDRDFKYYRNGHLLNWGYEGKIWVNPWWNPDKYKNEFKTKITLGSYSTSKNLVPNLVMSDFIKRWDKTRGKDICDLVYKKMKSKYGDRIYYMSP